MSGRLYFALTYRGQKDTMANPGSAITQSLVSASVAPVSVSAAQDGLPTPRRHYATLAIMATMVLVVLDGAIANVALPTATCCSLRHVSEAARPGGCKAPPAFSARLLGR